MHANDKAKALSKNKSAIGLKTAIRILENWSASVKQACAILRVSPSTYARAKSAEGAGWTVNLDADVMERISIVLNIHGALRVIFDNPKNVYGFISMKNNNEFFNGRAPLEIMAQGDFISLYETFRRIDSIRGANW